MTPLVAFLAIALALPRYVMAQAPDHAGAAAAQDHYRKGMRLYDLGRFEDAIREFEAAYQFQEDPFYIFNLAQAYRRAGNGAKALELYRTYLRKAPAAPDRADVEQRIAALERSLAATQPPPGGAASPAASPGAPPRSPQPVPPDARAAAALHRPDAAPGERAGEGGRRGGVALTAGVATAVAGLALMGTGAFFGITARQKLNDAVAGGTYDPGLDDSGRRARTLEYVFLGIGAAALVTGGGLMVLGFDDDGGRRRTALVPALAPHGAGAALRGTF